MRSLNKKAISDIVAVMLIISLSVLAASMLFSYISKSTLTLSPQLNCLQAQANQMLKIENARYDSSSQEVLVSVNRNFKDSNINFIEFKIIKKDGTTKLYQFGSVTSCTSAAILKAGETKTYYLSGVGNPENLDSLSVSANSCVLDTKEIII